MPTGYDGSLGPVVGAERLADVIDAYGRARIVVGVDLDLGGQVERAETLPESLIAQRAVQIDEEPLPQRVVAPELGIASGNAEALQLGGDIGSVRDRGCW